MRRHFVAAVLSASLLFPVVVAAQQTDMSNAERNQVDSMLSKVAGDVAKHYYDPTLHGLDWDAKVREARERIKQEKSLNMAMAHVAAMLDSLKDSHTFFVPPRRPYVLDHGWTLQMVGDKCFVTRVRPGGDAASHGLQPGDQLEAINGYRITRDNLWKIEYAFNTLRPLAQLVVTLRNPAGEERKAQLEAKFVERAKVRDMDAETLQNVMVEEQVDWMRETHIRSVEFGDDLLVVKLPSFMFDAIDTAHFIGQARKHKALILDLRENPGGAVETLKAVVGELFEHDITIAQKKMRTSSDVVVAKAARTPFTGKLYVLVDSKSASAAELLARVVQLENRGTVIGDLSSGSVMSGSVMEARGYSYGAGFDQITFHGASITDADLIMKDGHSLEHVGVKPDDVVLPTAADIAAGRDPVLAHAAEPAGVKLSPEDAGKMFPYQWPDNK